LVYVAASADGYVVCEELEGDYFADGAEELVGLGMWMAAAVYVGTADLDYGVLFAEVFSVVVYDLVTRHKPYWQTRWQRWRSMR
jgi:hypothetical protein